MLIIIDLYPFQVELKGKPKKLQRLQLTDQNPFATFNLSFPYWPRLGLPR